VGHHIYYTGSLA